MLGWDAESGHHLVLYDDGEHERVILAQEHITLQAPQRGNVAQTAPGLPEGMCWTDFWAFLGLHASSAAAASACGHQ